MRTELKTRDLKLRKNSAIIVFSQIASMGISFVIIPITLNLLGIGIYGIWLTLLSLIEWLNLFDFGFGHGLRNKFAEAKAKNENENLKYYVSTTFFILVFISIAIFFIFSIFNIFLNWSELLNAPSYLAKDLKKLAIFLCFVFCIRFIINIISTILTADQKPFIVAIITLSGSVLSLINLLLFKNWIENSILHVGICLSLSQLIPLLSSFVYFFFKKYREIYPNYSYFSKLYLKDIFSLGSQFFLIQVTNLVLIYSNNFIISHVIGNEKVTEYNLAYKYMNIINMIFIAILVPYWSSFTHAYANGEHEWIENTIKKINKLWGLSILFGVIAILLSPWAYKIWGVGNSIQTDLILLSLVFLYFLFNMRYTIFRTFMNGVGKIRLQFYITLFEAVCHIPLAILLGKNFGIYGIVFTMFLWSLINSIIEPIQFRKIINNKAFGIWNK